MKRKIILFTLFCLLNTYTSLSAKKVADDYENSQDEEYGDEDEDEDEQWEAIAANVQQLIDTFDAIEWPEPWTPVTAEQWWVTRGFTHSVQQS